MKKIFFSILGIVFAGISNISCTNSYYPPSKFIGLGTSYHGISNGQLPNDQDYTGFWTLSDDLGRTKGFYRNGIPIGTWIDYYPNGQMKSQRQYDGINKYVDMEYYPDGMIYVIARGTYSFKENELIETRDYSQYFDAEGNPFTREAEPNYVEEGDYRWRNAIVGPFCRFAKNIYKKDVTYYCYLFQLRNNKFYLWYYILPKNGIHPASKVIMQGQLANSPVSFEVSQIKHILGNDKVEIKSTFDNPVLKVNLETYNPLFGSECFDFEIELKKQDRKINTITNAGMIIDKQQKYL